MSVVLSAVVTADATQRVSPKSTAIVVAAPAEGPDDGSRIDTIYVISAVGASLVIPIAVVVAILICWRPRKSSQSATTVVVAIPVVEEYLIDDNTFSRHRQPTQLNPNAPDIKLFSMEEMITPE
jgi:hypothetical protein